MTKRQKQKKSVSKKVLALNEQLARRRAIRVPSKRFLILCEDEKSSVNYFKELIRHFRLSASSVSVVGSKGKSQPQQVVNRAKELKEAAESLESGSEAFDQVWCVIDGDYGNKITNARFSAAANQIELAITTKCFEYWVLLHFEVNDQSTNHCDELVAKLSEKGYLPGYDKGSCDFKTVVPQVHIASQRAKKLRAPGIARGEKPEDQNPCSEIYRLIEALELSDN